MLQKIRLNLEISKMGIIAKISTIRGIISPFKRIGFDPHLDFKK